MRGWSVFALIIVLFVALRLSVLMTFPVEALFRYGDFEYMYTVAVWSIPGHCLAHAGACLPLIDYWSEYPPLWPYLSQAILRLSGGGGLPPFHAYAYGVSLLLLGADLGCLVLVRRIAARLYSAVTADQISWVYALMPAPLIISHWTFDGLTAFWMLLALWALLERRDRLCAVSLAAGIMTKFVPALLLPAVWRRYSLRRALGITAGAAVICLAILLPFCLRSPAFTLASLGAQVYKSSYATVWALIDGNISSADGQPLTGHFGPLIERFDAANAYRPIHHAARVPGWLSVLAFGVMYAWLWRCLRRPVGDDHATVLFFGLTWVVFLLWNKGWSPQWQVMIMPLMLLTRPDSRGVLLALLLAAVGFLEWPVLLARGYAWGYWITVPLRTVLWVVWGVDLYRSLRAGAVTES